MSAKPTPVIVSLLIYADKTALIRIKNQHTISILFIVCRLISAQKHLGYKHAFVATHGMVIGLSGSINEAAR